MSSIVEKSRVLANMERSWPQDVGIVNMEIYFPSQYVDQGELEVFDGASAGKYTMGLGQSKMGFCDDREDINSLCLTVLDRLMRKTDGVTYKDIGRLEVGTETLIDKSKSVKSVLMRLFEGSGNSDVEGVDSSNACYGGTAALFNSVSWIESSYWDGRLAIVVCADIAVYATGNARPTGGAGAVAMLIGPNAPLVFERGLRSSHVKHVYDFYKPDMSSEYPTVDGKLSIQCYLQSLDQCYNLYKHKATQLSNNVQGDHKVSSTPVTLDSFDALLFHSPFCKLVQKSFARLYLNDFLSSSDEARMSDKFRGVERFAGIELAKTYFDRDVEKAFMSQSLPSFELKTKPTLLIATNVGNMYTPSLYGGLVSFLVTTPQDQLPGKKLGLFSYGSGLVSSFFSIRVKNDVSLICSSLSDVRSRLDARRKVDPSDFSAAMKVREETHHLAPYTPTGSVSDLMPGTWYLTGVDEMHRRTYARSDHRNNGHT